ncbi:MAG: Cysteine desulfurase [Methanonatronarchaeales archaeon]|nr:Cysteine desulfurase [Methanonatronarchaeales archaeon]
MGLSDDFPLTEEVVYLDSAATTLTPVSAGDAMKRFTEECGGNYGRGSHRLARDVTRRYENVREELSGFLGVEDHLVFTKNSTEALNACARGLPLDGAVVTTTLEHHSNLVPWMRHADELRLVEHRGGVLRPGDFEEVVDDDTALVTVTQVSNVYGSVQPVEDIGEIAHDHGALFLIDGAQSAGHLDVDVDEIGADLFAFSGHKGLLGPQGTGGLAMTEAVAAELEPLLLGGGGVHSVTPEGYGLEPAPQRFESGTPNLPGVIGLGASLDYLRDLGVKRARRISRRLGIEAGERLSGLDGVEVFRPENSTGVVSFSLDGWNPHDVASLLDRIGSVCVRSGHHCAIPALKGSAEEGTVRASFALYNDDDDLDTFLETVEKILSIT